jgi:hypothetical protein
MQLTRQQAARETMTAMTEQYVTACLCKSQRYIYVYWYESPCRFQSHWLQTFRNLGARNANRGPGNTKQT